MIKTFAFEHQSPVLVEKRSKSYKSYVDASTANKTGECCQKHQWSSLDTSGMADWGGA